MKFTQCLCGLLFFAAMNAHSSVSPEQIEQSLSLRDNWMPLTRDVLQDPTWVNEDQFTYKLSVDGGFTFFLDDIEGTNRQPAFGHQAVASALGEATNVNIDPLYLPFDQFSYGDNQQSIRFFYAGQLWQCQLAETVCEASSSPRQPKAFGVVRDLQVEANNPPQHSPDQNYQAQVSDYNLVVRDAAGEIAFATKDGSADNFYDPESIRWAPDSSALVIMKVEPGYERRINRVLAAPNDQIHPITIEQLYPKPGDAVDKDQPVLVNLTDKDAITVDNALFKNPYQINQLNWQQDSSGFTFTYVERGHQLIRLVAVDANTGQARALVTEESNTFVNQWNTFSQLLQTGDKGALWLSERDGWAHLYHYNDQGELVKQITKGEWRVRSVVHVDEDTQQIWFSASGMHADQDPYFEHFYRINFDGTGLTPLTDGNAHHEVQFSPDMQHYIAVRSRVDLPNIAELRSSSDASVVRELSRGDISLLEDAGFKAPQTFVAKGRDGETDIWGLIVKPQNFDPNRRYPVIENIYAGPHDSFVPKSFWPFGLHSGGDKVIGMQALADLGFIVVQIDGMGTANRSKAFHDVAWQNLADSGFPDRVLWHQSAADQYSWYNIKNGVGIYGASAGGHSTVAALLFHPETYRVGVAFAGNYDNRMDKISWNEQWMGYPVGPHYAEASVVEHAELLQGQLLIINGEQDSNVDPASTMQLVDALIKAEKDFDLLVVPGGEHSVGRSSGPIRYIQRRQFDFFLRHLQQQDTPDWNHLQHKPSSP